MEAKQRKSLSAMPEWLMNRQLNTKLTICGFLPTDFTIEHFMHLLAEENSEEEVYSPKIVDTLQDIEQAKIFFQTQDPLYYREYFHPWYYDKLAPLVLGKKLPIGSPAPSLPSAENNGNAILFTLLLFIILAAAGLVFSLFPTALSSHPNWLSN